MVTKSCFRRHVFALLVVALSLGCAAAATLYTVGDNSGWDISTDLDEWVQNKTFLVGDSLSFQYSSYHSLVELTKGDFNTCNTNNPLFTLTNTSSPNTTVPLTTPGDRFFSCGNSLHCLGGMKLHVQVHSNQTDAVISPTQLPADGPTSTPLRGPSKANKSLPASSATRLSSKGLFASMECLILHSLIGFLVLLGPT